MNRSIKFFFSFLVTSAFSTFSLTTKAMMNQQANILTKFAQNPDKMLIFAHRGGSMEAVENTIEAFEHAIQIGSHILEMDIHLTKDGKVVVVHDDSLSRVCGVYKYVSDLKYSEIPPISRYSKGGKEKVYRIPTLEEVFQRFPNVVMHMELKEGSTELIEATAKLIEQYKMEDYVIWGHRSQHVAEKLLQYSPRVRRIFPEEEVLRVFVNYIRGTFDTMPLNYYSFAIPSLGSIVGVRTGIREIDAKLNDVGSMKKMAKTLFMKLRERGVLVSFWTFDTEREFDYAVEHNAGGVITDVPTKLYNYLVKREKYLPVREEKEN